MSFQSSENEGIPFRSFFKNTYRSSGEQIVGLFIFLIISVALAVLTNWISHKSLKSFWYAHLVKAPWTLSNWMFSPLWTLSYLAIAFSIWSLWRRCSLRRLKLEASLFLAQLLFSFLWLLSFFIFRETLLSLIGIMLLCCLGIVSCSIYWKKERLAGYLMLSVLLWLSYLVSLNMAICMSNP